MTRRATPTSVPPTRTTRRSGNLGEFASLDLYASGNTVKIFKADENHNGVKAAPIVAKSPSVVTPASKKRPRGKSVQKEAISIKRSRSASSSSDAGSQIIAAPAPKKRGRKPKAADGTSSTKAAPAKQPAKGRKSRGAAALQEQLVAVKMELPSDDEEEAITVVASSRVSRPVRVRVSRPQRVLVVPRSAVARAANSIVAASAEVKAEDPLSLALEDLVDEHGPDNLAAKKKSDVVTLMHGVCMSAASKLVTDFDLVSGHLKNVNDSIQASNRVNADADKIATLERENQTLTTTLAAVTYEMAAVNTKMAAVDTEMAQLKRENEQLKEQQQRQQQPQMAPVAARAGPSRSATGRNGNQHSQVAQMPRTQRPQLPSGASTIGQSTVMGSARQLVNGIAGVRGMEDALAQVSVRAVTMGGVNEHGEAVERTISTRVETIEVTEGMDLAVLQAQGFEFVELPDAHGEDEEEEDHDNTARVEEVSGDEEDKEDEGAQPAHFVEEAE